MMIRMLSVLFICFVLIGCDAEDVMKNAVELNTKSSTIFVAQTPLEKISKGPSSLHVSPLDDQSFLLQWGAASDQTALQSSTRYNIYISNNSEDIVAADNLVTSIDADEQSEYSYELNVKALAIGASAGEYAIAVTALDRDGVESLPVVISNQTLMQSGLELAAGITLIDAEEFDFPRPKITIKEGEIFYKFDGVNPDVIPNLDTYLAYPATTGGVSYSELIKVTSILANGFVGKIVPLSEITSAPVTLSGSAVFEAK